MRVSADEGDEGYKNFSDAMSGGKVVRVYLDGVEQKKCTMADDELGQVTRCRLSENGTIQANPDKPDEVWLETVTGKVEIRFEDET